MKKLTLITIFFVFTANSLLAQWASNGANIYNSNTGSIGIGTSNPQALVDIGKILNPGDLSIIMARLAEGGGGTFLGVRGYDTQLSGTITNTIDVKSFAIEHSFYAQVNSSINFFRGGSTTGGSIGFNTNNNTEAMRILYNGNVGIGVSHPQNKLDVNGTIHTKDVLIDLNGWNDYVFKPAYQLPTLSDVKSYIDQNQHLPEIPSEQEMIKHGLDVAEINKLLMKKVEELTLYAIENERKDKEKDKLLASLQDQINALKQQLPTAPKKARH